jgi:superfamily I DNA/RNA helicase
MTTYRLVPARRLATAAPALDAAQQAVVGHVGGPLLVLAGPGTGKTTTLVEAVVDVIDRRGVAPESVLVLTFSRKAAEQLRDRIAARLGRTLGTTMAATFHSFAFGLIRGQAAPDLYAEALHLLSAPEQDVAIRTLLEDTPESVVWPPGLNLARGTRGFAAEVADFLSRARERGVSPEDLARLGREHDRPEWESAAAFLDQYLDVLDAQNSLDYADLIARAVVVAEQGEVRQALRERYTHIFVDEYQDTDPSQVALLQAIAGDGRNLTVVGDPDQSIYGFRGADVRGILDFPRDFPTTAGEKSPVIALDTTRRFGPGLLAASRRVVAGLSTSGAIDHDAFMTFRHPASLVTEPGSVEVLLYDNARAEAEHIADALRRAHLEDGIAWSEMAILVRSGIALIPGLKRALMASGIPIVVAQDETSLVHEPAVAALVEALRVALALRAGCATLEPARAEALLTSPLGGMDASRLRGVARVLRQREREVALAERRPARSSSELLTAALVDPSVCDGIEGAEVGALVHLARILRRTADLIDLGATPEEALWELWSATPWHERLQRSALDGGPGASHANRDLDALCALFDAAARAEGKRGHTSVENFVLSLAAQTLPTTTLADRGVSEDGVRLMTAHRSKGLEWRFVVLAHVQEGQWPDLRRRSSLLRVDELGRGELLPPTNAKALLAEERRLFYVGCTRARERLMITAVRSVDDNGDQPSRFLFDVVEEPREVKGRLRRPLTLGGIVTQLRRAVADPASPDALRDHAARRLARLAEAHHHRRPLAPTAQPDNWWGVREPTEAGAPLLAPDAVPSFSASDLNSIEACATKWFFESRAGGRTLSGAAQGFGTLVHAIAERIGRGEIRTDEDLMSYVDRVLPQLTFSTPWESERERVEVEAALERFVSWHEADRGRTLLALEPRLRATVPLPDGTLVEIRGFADRLELDSERHVVVVDLKTQRSTPSKADVAQHPQLGLYQLAVEHGGLVDIEDAPRVSGGAELVQLRHTTYNKTKVQPQPPQTPGEDGLRPIERQLIRAVSVVRGEEFPVTPGSHCAYCSFTAICPAKGEGTVLQ